MKNIAKFIFIFFYLAVEASYNNLSELINNQRQKTIKAIYNGEIQSINERTVKNPDEIMTLVGDKSGNDAKTIIEQHNILLPIELQDGIHSIILNEMIKQKYKQNLDDIKNGNFHLLIAEGSNKEFLKPDNVYEVRFKNITNHNLYSYLLDLNDFAKHHTFEEIKNKIEEDLSKYFIIDIDELRKYIDQLRKLKDKYFMSVIFALVLITTSIGLSYIWLPLNMVIGIAIGLLFIFFAVCYFIYNRINNIKLLIDNKLKK